MPRIISQATYYRLVDAFREDPGNLSRASKKVGVFRGTARRAWHQGYPDRELPPIKRLLEEETFRIRSELSSEQQAKERADLEAEQQAKARLAVEAEQIRQREQAKQDAISVGVDEVRVVRASQTNAMATLAVSNNVLKSAFRVFVAHKAMVEAIPERELQEKVKDQKFMKEMREHASMAAYCAKAASDVAKLTMEMERMRLGKPVAVIGVELPLDMTAEQALKELKSAESALLDAVRSGLAERVDMMVPPPVAGGVR